MGSEFHSQQLSAFGGEPVPNGRGLQDLEHVVGLDSLSAFVEDLDGEVHQARHAVSRRCGNESDWYKGHELELIAHIFFVLLGGY